MGKCGGFEDLFSVRVVIPVALWAPGLRSANLLERKQTSSVLARSNTGGDKFLMLIFWTWISADVSVSR